jgi:hypothetical protein
VTALLPSGEPELRHGRRWTYIRYRCRCEACRAAASDYRRARYAQHPASRSPMRRLEVRIGTLLGPAPGSSNQYSEPSVATEGSLDHHDFRKMAADPEVVEDVPRLPAEPLRAALRRRSLETGRWTPQPAHRGRPAGLVPGLPGGPDQPVRRRPALLPQPPDPPLGGVGLGVVRPGRCGRRGGHWCPCRGVGASGASCTGPPGTSATSRRPRRARAATGGGWSAGGSTGRPTGSLAGSYGASACKESGARFPD